MSRPRVFFPIKTPRFDVSVANAYGEPVFLLKTEGFSPFSVDMIFRIFRAELQRAGFDPAADFIGVTGPTNFTYLLGVFTALEYGQVRTLLFDARFGGYMELLIPPGPVPARRTPA